MAAQPQERVRKRLVWFSPVLLAVALTPAFLQTQYSCNRGDTYLLPLQVEVGGFDQIDSFHPDTRYYDIAISGDNVLLRAVTRDPTSTATYQLYVDGSVVEADTLGVGGGEVTLSIPIGPSTLNVSVRATQGGVGNYEVDITRLPEFPCTEQGILDAIAFGGGPHFFACNGPTTVTTLDEIFIYNDVILDGEGNLTVDGNDDHRVLSVVPGVTAELMGVTVSGGFADVPWPVGGQGGGISNEGTLTISDSVIQHNSAQDGARGGGIYSRGVLELVNSSVRENWISEGEGGGVYSEGTLTLIASGVSGNGAWVDCNSGCGIDSTGTLTLIDSYVSDNDGQDGAGIDSTGTLTLINSTVTESPYWGILSDGTAAIINSTVDGTWEAAIEHSGTLTVISSTLTAEASCCGFGTVTASEMIVANSLIVAPRLEVYGSTCFGTVISLGGNIESPTNDCGLTDPTDLVNVTAAELDLGPLGNHGGPTMTWGLLPGSVAIDHVPAAMCVDDNGDPLTTDQRGVARPQGASCDAGAFEWADCSGSICDDGNECTADYCDPPDYSWCLNSVLPDGTSCDFGGLPGLCVAGVCEEEGSCPVLTSVTVTPLQANVGDEINVSAEASGAGPINYLWTATGGSFVDPSLPTTAYLCEEAGQQDLTITISDGTGSCTDESTVTVTCLGDPDPCSTQDLDANGIPDVCPPGYNYIEGTAGPDIIVGTTDPDCIFGLGGNDDIVGGDGIDYICAGDGADVVNGDAGGDRIYGGADSDTMSGGDGSDYVNGDAGDDTLSGGPDNDTLDGGAGTNNLFGNSGIDVCLNAANMDPSCENFTGDWCSAYPNGFPCSGGGVCIDGICDFAGVCVYQPVDCDASDECLTDGFCDPTCDPIDAGNGLCDRCPGKDEQVRDGTPCSGGVCYDGVCVNAQGGCAAFCQANNPGCNVVNCVGGFCFGTTSGSDCINGTAGADVIFGLEGDDCICAGGGNDTVQAGAGNDSVFGGDGTDIISGEAGADRLFGEGDNDDVNGGDDADVISGGSGNDNLNGDTGDDTLFGDDGDDTLNGGANYDVIEGGDGNDIINGDDGDDTLSGGPDNDTLDGGAGTNNLFGNSGIDVCLNAANMDPSCENFTGDLCAWLPEGAPCSSVDVCIDGVCQGL